MTVTMNVYLRLISVILKIHSDLPFLPERIKAEKCQKRFRNMHEKNKYVKFEMDFFKLINDSFLERL